LDLSEIEPRAEAFSSADRWQLIADRYALEANSQQLKANGICGTVWQTGFP
jgi:hypothetical protein